MVDEREALKRMHYAVGYVNDPFFDCIYRVFEEKSLGISVRQGITCSLVLYVAHSIHVRSVSYHSENRSTLSGIPLEPNTVGNIDILIY